MFKIPESKLKYKEIDYTSGIRNSLRSKSEIKRRLPVVDGPSDGLVSTSSKNTHNKSTFVVFEEDKKPVRDIMKAKVHLMLRSDRKTKAQTPAKRPDERSLSSELQKQRLLVSNFDSRRKTQIND